MAWKNEQVEILTNLWEDGLSASQIAAKLGGKITRNAVIGKIHRLGLSKRRKKLVQKNNEQANVETHSVAQAAVGHSSTNLAFKQSEPELPPTMPQDPQEYRDNVIQVVSPKTLIELNDNTCRWPIGNPGKEDFYFCGIRPKFGSRYCDRHYNMAHQSSPVRRKSSFGK